MICFSLWSWWIHFSVSGPLSVCRENCVDVTMGRINLILTVFLSILPPNLDSDYNLRGDYKKKMVKIWTDISREKGDRVSSESSFLYMKLLSFDWKSNVFFMMPHALWNKKQTLRACFRLDCTISVVCNKSHKKVY